MGGPDGGDGGRGGDVGAIAVESVRDLGRVRAARRVGGEKGADGLGAKRSGSAGKLKLLEVPVGTEVSWRARGAKREVVEALTADGDHVVVARGGAGGRGNVWFAGPINRTPVLAEAGEPGEEVLLQLEVKLVADVALIGPPNAGKSALLAWVSNAKPKVAEYPFTTVEPMVGMLEHKHRSVAFIDLPGLAEGAHQGRGLGNEFLRHAERAHAMVLVLDGASDDLVSAYAGVKAELRAYEKGLAEKPLMVVVSKIDEPEVQARVKSQRRALGAAVGQPVLPMSAETGQGVDELLEAVLHLVPEETSKTSKVAASVARPAKQAKTAVRVEGQDGDFTVWCTQAERVAPMVDFHKWEARMQFHQLLGTLGVIRELEKAGVNPGDTVHIGPVELEWR